METKVRRKEGKVSPKIAVLQEQIEYMQTHDGLTGLYNRRQIEKKIRELDIDLNIPFSIIMVDINGLRKINEKYNYGRGDKVLLTTARILSKLTTSRQVVGRWGEDEFVILLPEVSRPEAEQLNKRIKLAAENYSKLGLSLSTGIASKNFPEDEIKDVIKEATENMNWDKSLNSHSSNYKIIQGFLSTLAAKSDETREHSQRMQDLAVIFADSLGMTNSDINKLKMLAYLHDIGKINIDQQILNKPDRLTDPEWYLIKQHPGLGYNVVKAIEDFAPVADYILSHHERWDGKGYPQGLKGEEIPYLSRIIAIIDSYDVMTHERPYKVAMSQPEALAEISRCAGSQFDPHLAQQFIQLLTEQRKCN